MIQEQKDLLLKDLCARLPYNVKVYDNNGNFNTSYVNLLHINGKVSEAFVGNGMQCRIVPIDEIRPYLFPMSSMTEEQKEFIKNKFCYDWDIDDHPYSLWAHCIDIGDIDELIDWFHKNHFDYRGLIEKGLAIDATNLNIY